jgi:cytochrome c6
VDTSTQICKRVRGVARIAVISGLMVTAAAVPAHAKEAKNPGKPVFEANCVFCHGDDGTGKTGPGQALGAHDLTSAGVAKKSDSDLAQTITQGQNKMPAFGNKLDETQIRDVISYIRTFRKKD